MTSYTIVQKATSHPGACAVSGFSDGPFLDTGARCHNLNPHIYLNVDVLKQMARAVGMVPNSDLAAARDELAQLEARLAQCESELATANHQLDAIDVIESRDFRARKKPGRKPQTQTEQVS